MSRQFSRPDPEVLLQLMENTDRDFSDNEFDGYVSDNEEMDSTEKLMKEIEWMDQNTM